MEVLIYPDDNSGYCELYRGEEKTQMTFISLHIVHFMIFFDFSVSPNSSLSTDSIKYYFDTDVGSAYALGILQLFFPYCKDLGDKNDFETFKSYCQYFDRNPPK